MRLILLPLLLALSSAAVAREDEVPFEPSAERFANAAACKARLVVLVAEARARDHVAVQGPYDVSSGDVRAHHVLASGSGHRITEHRCLAEQLSSRTWRHSMDGAEADEPDTIESMAAKAEWLKKPKSE